MDTSIEPKKKAASRGLGSIDVGMRLLNVLAEAGQPMKLKDIAAAADMPAAKAHRYMASFLHCAMVSQEGRSGRYELGPFAVRLGVAALSRNNVIERASKNLAALRDDIRETCFVSCWSDRGPIIVKWEDSLRPVTVIVHVGSTMPLLKSATGRVYLAFLSPEKLLPVLERERAEAGMTNEQVGILASEIRAAGVARIEGAFQERIAGLSAPLVDPFGDMVGAVTAMGNQSAFGTSTGGQTAVRLKKFANKMSASG